jgi:uncharacterized protein (DUF2236 family)
LAGFAQNSDYKRRPWQRLQRTARYVGTVVYGTTEEAEAAGRRLREVHARLRATDPRTGEVFRVDEPDLLRWVHVTEVESFLSVARRAGVKLTDAEADLYYVEQRRAAALVGLDPVTVPDSAAAVARYYADMQPCLAVDRETADALFFLLNPPMPGWLGIPPVRAAYAAIAALGVGLLPAWARRRYGLLGLPLADPAASVSARALRLGMAALPRQLLEGPVYRAAMARVRAAAPAAEGQTSIPDHGSRAGLAAMPAGQPRR